MGFDLAVDLRFDGRYQAELAIQSRSFSFQHKPLADAINSVVVHVQPLGDFATGEPAPVAGDVCEQLPLLGS